MAALKIHRTNTILYCRQWQATVGFYKEQLGLRINQATNWFVEFQLAENQFVSIADAAKSTIVPADGNGITLSWQVGDLTSAHRELNRRGIAVSPILPKWGARVCYFHDPEGNRIELWSSK